MTDFHLSTDDDDDESAARQCASKASSHETVTELYIKRGTDEVHVSTAAGQQNEGYNPLHYWKKKHSSYPISAKVVPRILGVPTTSAAVEREFSFAGNFITEKRSRFSPDTVNGIVFNYP